MKRIGIIVAALLLSGPAFAAGFLPAGAEFLVTANAVAKAGNDDIPTTTPPITLDEGAYLVRLAAQWPAPTAKLGLTEDNYYAVFAAKGLNDIEDEYVESCESIGVIYGQKYFLTGQRKGFAVGWYAGGESWSCDGFDYSGSTRFAGYSESGLSAIVAGEAGYEGRFRIGDGMDFYVHPGVAFSFDKDYNELNFLPVLELGLVFK